MKAAGSTLKLGKACFTDLPSILHHTPVLTPDQVHVWSFYFADALHDADSACVWLSEDEKIRAEGFYFSADRRSFLVCRAWLRTLLSHYTGVEPMRLQLGYGRYGKPELPDHHLRFNLTHCKDMALLAITSGRLVGIDLEQVKPQEDFQDIALRYFAPAEYRQMMMLPETLRLEAFFACWTRKEAYVKARGEGLSLALDRFRVSLLPDEPAALLQNTSDPQEVARWGMRALVPAPGYVGAVVAEGKDWTPLHF